MARNLNYFNRVCLLLPLLLLLSFAANHCEARKFMHMLRGQIHTRSPTIQHIKRFKVTKHFDLASLLLQKETMDPSNANPYVSSPFSLPPYDSLSPNPLPENAPPFCIYPPNTPVPPSTTIPSPSGSTPYLPTPSPFSYLPPFLPIPNPPPGPITVVPSPPETAPLPNPPEIVPGPPTTYVPIPPESIPSPPYYEPSPPSYTPSPPTFVPSPTVYVPSPSIFLPPVVYPPPTVPPPPRTVPPQALWCVAKPSVPDPIIQEAMNYACGSGADCESIQPSRSCFEPNTLFAHASYAFNSYWQRTKVAGGTCSFGGTAMLVTVDPSYDGCHFVYS